MGNNSIKGIILSLIFFLSYSIGYANPKHYILKLKTWTKEQTVIVYNLQKEKIIYEVDNKKYSITYEDIEYIKATPNKYSAFDTIIILIQPENVYYEGQIIYQDREKISIYVKGGLKHLALNNIKSIVDKETFYIERSKTKWIALSWSLLYPGLGQFYTYDRTWTGILYTSLFTLSTFSSILFWQLSEYDYNLFQESKYQYLSHYNNYYTKWIIMWTSIGISTAIYIWNIVDALIFFKSKFPNVKAMNITNIFLDSQIQFTFDLKLNYIELTKEIEPYINFNIIYKF